MDRLAEAQARLDARSRYMAAEFEWQMAKRTSGESPLFPFLLFFGGFATGIALFIGAYLLMRFAH